MSGGKIALLAFGIIFLVGALVVMVGGGGLMWLSKTLENDNPLFVSRETRVRKADSYAIVTEPFGIDWHDESEGQRWGYEFVTVTIEVESQDPSRAVFVGIAREADVDGYLSGVRYHEIVEWKSDPFDDPEVNYEPHTGDMTPSDPASQSFWDVSAYGSGRQTIEWHPEMGRWVLVIMNEDGSEGIDVSGTVGADLPWLFWLGIGLMPLGILMLAAGAVMVYLAARSPKKPVIATQIVA